MPSSSNPSPRRSSQGATSQSAPARNNSRGQSHPDAARTVDLSPSYKRTGKAKTSKAPLDAGAKRRALKKKRGRQSNLLAWTAAAAISVVLAGMAFGVRAAGVKTKGIWTEFESAKNRVTQKRAVLADLNAQLESGKRRLGALASASGKERVLVENGFIKPGERLLLFPKPQIHKK